MNEESATLHATEPCHLAFGELVNGRFESGKHGLVVRLPRQIQGDEFVFQPVIDQIIGRNATVEKSLDFLYHTLVHTGMEPVRYPFASGVAIQIETDDQTVDRRKLGAFGRIVLDVFGYFDSPDSSLCRVHVRLIVQRAVCSQYKSQLCQTLSLQTITKRRVGRNIGEVVAFEHGFDIHTRTSAEDRIHATSEDRCVGLVKVVLISKEVVFVPCRSYIDQVARDCSPSHLIVGQVFACADVHATVYLSRVGTDDLGSQPICEAYGQTSLAACRRPQDRYHPRSLSMTS